MTILFEYRPNLRRSGPPRLQPLEDMAGKQGFQSLYGYPPRAQMLIRERKGTHGLKYEELYADTLFVDFDNDPAAVAAAAQKLRLRQISHTVYTSGSKGHHIHIFLVPEQRIGLPDVHLAWVKQNLPGADLSIYKSSGIIRIAGSGHKDKPGAVKAVTATFPGGRFSLAHCEPPRVLPMLTLPQFEDEPVDEEMQSRCLTHMLMLPVATGSRNEQAYCRAALCRDLNYDMLVATDMISTWNYNHCQPPLPEREVVTVVQSAFRRRA